MRGSRLQRLMRMGPKSETVGLWVTVIAAKMCCVVAKIHAFIINLNKFGQKPLNLSCEHLFVGRLQLSALLRNLLTEKCDLRLISPYNTTSESHLNVTRIKEVITN